MFEPSDSPRVFGVGLGVDFPKALLAGLRARLRSHPPHAFSQVELIVNTRKMQSRLHELLLQSGPTFFPRIRVVSDLVSDVSLAGAMTPVSPLRRRLELRQLVIALLAREPDLAPQSSAFDLADSLAKLMDEMHSEGVTPETLRDLDVGDMSKHWERSLSFVSLVDRYFGEQEEPDVETLLRLSIEEKIRNWTASPPEHPIIIAGSTGSRGATALLMQAVAKLPQGAVILPGVDEDMSEAQWSRLDDSLTGEDHPQFRFAKLARNLSLTQRDIIPWDPDSKPANARRNALVSLALCPAPITDQWMVEGKEFLDVQAAGKGLTLVEARLPREEAQAIAVILKKSLQDGVPVALITPDRNLTRQVSAILDRWHLIADDSAGRPLSLSAPGRFLRQVLDLLCSDPGNEGLLALLKHPLTHSAPNGRGDHLRRTRELELQVLRGHHGPLSPQKLLDWAAKFEEDPDRLVWAKWIIDTFFDTTVNGENDLTSLLAHHLRLAESIAQGVNEQGASQLWQNTAGEKAREIVSKLEQEAAHGGKMAASEYRDLFRSVFDQEVIRDTVSSHPGIMIWGTMEARVQGADRVILAGLNEGSWPEMPSPDPWLNRQLRLDAGLLLPERRTGLSAHDFQQAIATKEVFLTRAKRDDESETIPSRWLNRLCNLMSGMSEEGIETLEEMRKRGKKWLAWGSMLDQPKDVIAASPRPSPAPPVSTRPNQLSATSITRLVRDPYSIYAEKVLGLRALAPLSQTDDPLLRGTAIHEVFEKFVAGYVAGADTESERTRLLAIAQDVLGNKAPSRAVKLLWLARIEKIADWFIDGEKDRQARADEIALEIRGAFHIPELGFTLNATADRVDRLSNGQLDIYDYKTGQPPSKKAQLHFDKQLLLEAVIAEAGGFKDIPPCHIRSVCYLGLGKGVVERTEITPEITRGIREELHSLIRAYSGPERGYTSRRAVQKQRFDGDYDQLARFGEWDDSEDAKTMGVGT